MGWHSKGFQVRKNKGVENSPPKTPRPQKTFILERIITPSALVPGGVHDSDALHQLLNSLSLLSFDFSDWAKKINDEVALTPLQPKQHQVITKQVQRINTPSASPIPNSIPQIQTPYSLEFQ
ncbi:MULTISPECIES: hypothetical protein [unclassified Microcoleus]|uniref:hypothetical protein n=1 Tax=unclassified Microcoleus TaxID=2642155 RepID=UPI002FD0B7F3